MIANTHAEFPPATFDILAFCDGCGHCAPVDRARIPPELSVQALPGRLRCSRCGSRDTEIRIVYTGAGGFRHGFGGQALTAQHDGENMHSDHFRPTE